MYYPCPDFFVLYEIYEEKLEVDDCRKWKKKIATL